MKNKIFKMFKVDSYFRLFVIFLVFGITGSLSVYLGKYILIGIFSEKFIESDLFWIIRLLFVFPLYQFLLIIVGSIFGEFKYFWEIEKKILSRLKILKSPPS
tara:strand:+ start:282 stop:587 length:306 start_codon:yes stop_codon:yes gene_type:complete